MYRSNKNPEATRYRDDLFKIFFFFPTTGDQRLSKKKKKKGTVLIIEEEILIHLSQLENFKILLQILDETFPPSKEWFNDTPRMRCDTSQNSFFNSKRNNWKLVFHFVCLFFFFFRKNEPVMGTRHVMFNEVLRSYALPP